MADGMEKGERRRVGKYVRVGWSIQPVGLIALFMAGMFGIFLMLRQDVLFVKYEDLPLYTICLAGVFLAMHLVYVELRYNSLYYIIGRDEIVVRSGILSVKKSIIPYSKIQHVSLRRGILNRIFNTANLVVETAGGKAEEAEVEIPSVTDFDNVMAEISERIGKARGTAPERGAF